MSIQIKKNNMLSRVKHTLSACCFVTVLSVSLGSAWAFDTYQGVIAEPARGSLARGNTSLTTKSPSPSMVDQCLPLLNSIHHIPSSSAMDRNQRSAGKAATLGLVFGVKFALAPPRKTGQYARNKAKARLDVWQHEGAFEGDRHALAVASYRQCQKERALNALSNLHLKE